MKRTLTLLLMFTFLAGCQGGAPGLLGERNPASAPSAVPLPSEIPPATPTPAPTATLTPIPTPTERPNPMSIEAMRGREYPGSQIVIEQELTAAANYKRYYAYYLSEGLKIYALLTVPSGEAPPGGWPAIVFNHGYIAPSVYKTTERYVAYVDRLAKAGYIVFRIDYRGHDRSEGAARGAYGDPGYTVDVLNAVSALKQFPQANPEKIGMWGHSMGGYLTLRAMVISKDVKAGVIWSGVVGSYEDMIYNWRRGAAPPAGVPAGTGGWRQNWISRYGTPEENPAFWESVSATSYLEDLSGPLQLHHSEQDEDVPAAFSRSLAERIEAAGGDVELIIYPDDDHDITRYFTSAMNSTVAFFDKYLK